MCSCRAKARHATYTRPFYARKNMNMEKIQDETKFVLESLLRIKEAAKNDIIDSVKRDEQLKRIDSIIQKFNQGFTVEDSFNLTNERFGGSFGMLLEDSKLLFELRKHTELVMKLTASIKKNILSKNLILTKLILII